MKIRSAFVSNSSSSSYVIGLKGIAEAIDAAPPGLEELVGFVRTLLEDVYSGKKITDDEELRAHFKHWYGWSDASFEEVMEQEGEWVQARYKKAKDALDQGYVLYYLTLEYEDNLAYNMDKLTAGPNVMYVYGDE